MCRPCRTVANWAAGWGSTPLLMRLGRVAARHDLSIVQVRLLGVLRDRESGAQQQQLSRLASRVITAVDMTVIKKNG